MKVGAIFLCGDRSPYGLGHLEAIAEHFNVKALIVADRTRWAHFRYVLSGGKTYVYQTTAMRAWQRLKNAVKWWLYLLREARHRKRLRSIGAPVYVLNDVNSSNALQLIKSLNPEVLISAAYPQIFKKPLLDIPPRGAINFHPSLLPRCRGAHPHYWCLASGEKLGGVSAHYMTEQIDGGDIIAQRSFGIDGLYYHDLYNKIIEETPHLVSSVAEFLNKNNATPTPQNESLATVFRNDREIHHRLDFLQMTASQLHNRIRAGGAYGLFRGTRTGIVLAEIFIKNRHMINGVGMLPGVIVDIDSSGVWVATKDCEFLVVKKLTDRGKVRHFSNWISDNKIQIGERLD